MHGHRRSQKTICAILLAVVILIILCLTFQDSAGTVKLSESIRLWLSQFGIHSDFHSFRSNAHLVVYFVLGIALSLFGREFGLKWWVVLIVGCAFGLLDECLKIFLPTREFDVLDLIKDWIGIVMAAIVIMFMNRKNDRN